MAAREFVLSGSRVPFVQNGGGLTVRPVADGHAAPVGAVSAVVEPTAAVELWPLVKTREATTSSTTRSTDAAP
mgnify:CR=1 FL=1